MASLYPRLTPFWSTSGEPASSIRDRHWAVMAPWIATAFVAVWVFVYATQSTAQWGDNLEQFVWAHSLEWGYHKHPPLPTWLLGAWIAIVGPSPLLAILLAGACTAATGWLTYRIAQRLLGNPWAALALMLWGLQQAFSSRASLFNHNTVMMVSIAATVWSVLRALEPQARPTWWLLCGSCAAAAMLSKYQSIIPLGGIVLALHLSGELAQARVRRGLTASTLVALLLMTPHLAWIAANDFSTLGYATQHGKVLDSFQRCKSVVGFMAQQLRLLAPALLFAALVLRPLGSPGSSDRELPEETRTRRAWLIGLIGFPLVATILAAPLLGLKLQNHWGFQCLQFAGLYFAHLLRRRASVSIARWVAMAALVHAAFLAVDVTVGGPGDRIPTRRIDARYPAQQLAAAVERDWHDTTGCPLRIIVGPPFEAGLVSVYSGGQARVLESGDFRKSPWITAADLARAGAVYVAFDAESLPKNGVSRINSLDVSQVSPAPMNTIFWAIAPPQGCQGKAE